MKKITIYKIILVILIIIAAILLVLTVRKNVESKQIEEQAQTVLSQIKTAKQEITKETEVVREIDAELEGYKVIGIIKIPKIDIEYPILEKTDKTSLKLSITKFWGEKINQKGNVVLAGHNNLNNRMFGRINELENGDIIELTDSQMVTVKYEVFKTYIVDPNDITCILPEQENTREVTLITCINRDTERLIIKARNVEM